MPRLSSRRVVVACSTVVCLLLWGCESRQSTNTPNDLTKLERYDYEKPIVFDGRGPSERFKLTGWAGTEPPFVWSDGIAASLAIRLPATEDLVQLQIKMAGMNVPKRVPFQRVDLYINTEKVARWQVAREDVFTVTVPPKFVAQPDSLLIIDFYIPKAVSPASLGVGGDQRRLGVRLSELKFVRNPEPSAAPGAASETSRVRSEELVAARAHPAVGDAGEETLRERARVPARAGAVCALAR